MTTALDIREGDILSVDGKQYAIRAVENWETTRMSKSSFLRMAVKAAVTLRSPVMASGKRGEPAINLSAFFVTPLDPVDAEKQRRLAIDTPVQLLQTMCAGDGGFMVLYVEDVKRGLRA